MRVNKMLKTTEDFYISVLFIQFLVTFKAPFHRAPLRPFFETLSIAGTSNFLSEKYVSSWAME